MHVPTRFLAGLASLGGLLGAWGCATESSNPGTEAELRVLHATPALGAVTVDVAGVTVIQSVSYGMASDLVRVPRGRQRIVVRAGAQVLGELEPTLSDQHVNSVVVSNGTPRFLDLVTPDTGTTATNRANLRMVNIVGTNLDPPTLLDVLVKAPNANPDSVMKFGVDTRIARYGTLMYFDPGHFNFKYLPAGGTTLLAEVSFDMAVGEKKAVVLERAADGTYRVQVVVEP